MTFKCPKCETDKLFANEVQFWPGNRVRMCNKCWTVRNTEQRRRRNERKKLEKQEENKKRYVLLPH